MILRFLVICFSISAADLASAAEVFPGKEWLAVSPAKAGWSTEALKRWEEFTFSGPHITDSALVVHRGQVVFERYARGYTPEMKHLSWSMGKSIWTSVFAIAESRGLISREDRVTRYFPEKKGTAWDDVALKHLTTMTSGVISHEGYQYSPFRSDIVAALYRTRYLGDKGRYRMEQTRRVALPGEWFAYSSGETNLLSAAMKKALPETVYSTLASTDLFAPIGARSFVMERDHQGVIVGSSYVYATMRDYARFGYLYLRGGKWNSGSGVRQVIPAAWVKEAQEPSSAFATLRLDHRPMEAYSNGWWLNRPVPTAQLGKVLASAPADLFWAEGHEGQYIFVVPSLDLVVVRLGLDREKDALNRDRFFKLLIEAMPPSKSKAGAR